METFSATELFNGMHRKTRAHPFMVEPEGVRLCGENDDIKFGKFETKPTSPSTTGGMTLQTPSSGTAGSHNLSWAEIQAMIERQRERRRELSRMRKEELKWMTPDQLGDDDYMNGPYEEDSNSDQSDEEESDNEDEEMCEDAEELDPIDEELMRHRRGCCSASWCRW